MSTTFRVGVVLGLVLVTLIGIQVQFRSPTSKPAIPTTLAASEPELKLVEVTTVGMDMRAQTPVVLLRQPETGQVLPIWVGFAEAQAIARALHGIQTPRPMTHDLMASLLKQLEATVKEVVVHDLREGTYFGMVRVEVPGKKENFEVDSRPSDAMALALRLGSPILVAGRVLDEAPDFDFVPPEESEQVVRAIGITVVTPTPALRREFRLPDRPGVVISAVTPEMEELGLRRGDLVVDINDVTPGNPIEFFEAVRLSKPGELIRLVIWRDGEEKSFELPGVQPEPPDRRGRSLRI